MAAGDALSPSPPRASAHAIPSTREDLTLRMSTYVAKPFPFKDIDYTSQFWADKTEKSSLPSRVDSKAASWEASHGLPAGSSVVLWHPTQALVSLWVQLCSRDLSLLQSENPPRAATGLSLPISVSHPPPRAKPGSIFASLLLTVPERTPPLICKMGRGCSLWPEKKVLEETSG